MRWDDISMLWDNNSPPLSSHIRSTYVCKTHRQNNIKSHDNTKRNETMHNSKWERWQVNTCLIHSETTCLVAMHLSPSLGSMHSSPPKNAMLCKSSSWSLKPQAQASAQKSRREHTHTQKKKKTGAHHADKTDRETRRWEKKKGNKKEKERDF